jgi:hypothetical protein
MWHTWAIISCGVRSYCLSELLIVDASGWAAVLMATSDHEAALSWEGGGGGGGVISQFVIISDVWCVSCANNSKQS